MLHLHPAEPSDTRELPRSCDSSRLWHQDLIPYHGHQAGDTWLRGSRGKEKNTKKKRKTQKDRKKLHGDYH